MSALADFFIRHDYREQARIALVDNRSTNGFANEVPAIAGEIPESYWGVIGEPLGRFGGRFGGAFYVILCRFWSFSVGFLRCRFGQVLAGAKLS